MIGPFVVKKTGGGGGRENKFYLLYFANLFPHASLKLGLHDVNQQKCCKTWKTTPCELALRVIYFRLFPFPIPFPPAHPCPSIIDTSNILILPDFKRLLRKGLLKTLLGKEKMLMSIHCLLILYKPPCR